ncbi:hypothetical protein, partial [uncultured Phocaeicola sp.]|uniref:hypothetical protein n=1 Tax=uncultured Phocaeicola sp. TaxID=990718 RepID=UPI00259A4C90
MSDDRLKFASYKYKRDGIEVTAKISLHKRELGLKDYLLAPRSPFYIKIENGIRYDEKPLIIEGKDIKDMNERFERITFFYYVKSYLYAHKTILELPFLDFIDVGNHVKFVPVNFSPDNDTYIFFMYCDCSLYPQLSKLVKYDIKESELYSIVWIVTEQSVTLNKIQNNVNSFPEACQTAQELYKHQNHIEFKNLVFDLLARHLYS